MEKMHSPSPPGPWSFFDRVYCISLEEREDRRREARKQFGRVGLAERVEFVIEKKHPTDNEQGIYEAHMRCFRKAVREDARRIVIFEDDVIFDRFRPEALAECVRFLSAATDWKILFFGCLVSGSRATAHPSVAQVRYSSLSHAYAIERGFAETLLGMPWRKIPYDMLLRSLSREYYAACPLFAFQSNAATDNRRFRNLDRFRRWCGGLARIQKMNEWYHRHRRLVIWAHLFLILILMILIMLAFRR